MLAAACFLVVVATHVCEAYHLLSFMGWGRPTSIGHYIDLSAAVLGVASVVVATVTAIAHRVQAR